MSLLAPSWRCFQAISSDAEAATYSQCCLFSLATLEVECDSETNNFALTEQERPGEWRWVVINARGAILQIGSETTLAKAKTTATLALHFNSSAPPSGDSPAP